MSEPKYTLAAVAEAAGKEPAVVRAALRKSDLEKPEGGRWGWNTKAEFDKAVSIAKGAGAAKPKTEAAKPAAKPTAKPKADAKADAKPAAKGAAKPKADAKADAKPKSKPAAKAA